MDPNTTARLVLKIITPIACGCAAWIIAVMGGRAIEAALRVTP